MTAEPLEIKVARLQEKVEARDKALEVQAAEYERRLHDLNGEYKRDRERQREYVSTEKHEADLKAERLKFSEFVVRYEQRHEELVNAQFRYVTTDKYEDKLASEKDAREHALTRIDEKFNEYVQRWELRQREMDQTIATLSKAASEARRIAEDQGRQTRAEADAQAQRNKDEQREVSRRQTRNITVMGIVLASVVGLANLLPNLL